MIVHSWVMRAGQQAEVPLPRCTHTESALKTQVGQEGMDKERKTAPVPELCVRPLLNHSLTHVPSLAWNTARIGEKTSEVTVKYLKILRRKMM